MNATRGLRVGTRASALALAQTRLVIDLLRATGCDAVEIVELSTGGDRGAGAADKSRWVDTIEDALLAGEIDLAVHSAKDLPTEPAAGLELLGAPARAAVEDVLCLASGRLLNGRETDGVGAAGDRGDGGHNREEDVLESGWSRVRARARASSAIGIDLLQPGSRVGTSSIRRLAQLRSVREDLEVVALAGNVDTRLRKLADPDERLDAIVLARAGLQRLGLESVIAGPDTVLDSARFVPAPGQGALALQARAADDRVRTAVAGILDGDATACLRAERALAHALGASCNTPLGAYARAAGCGCIELRAWVGLPDGSAWLADELLGGFYDPEQLGARVAERMLSAGAGELLRAAEAMAE